MYTSYRGLEFICLTFKCKFDVLPSSVSAPLFFHSNVWIALYSSTFFDNLTNLTLSQGLLIEHTGRRILFWRGYGLMSATWVIFTVTLNLKVKL